MTTENKEQQAQEQFFMRKPKRFRLDEIEESELSDEDIRLAFAVFKATLDEIVGAVQAFYKMASAAVVNAHFNQVMMANALQVKLEFIRGNKGDNDEEIFREARQRAKKEMDNISEEREEDFVQQAADQLLTLSKSLPEVIVDSNNAILRQSSVMLWSATENLLREFFRISLNRQPFLSKQLFDHDEAKRYWNVRDLTIDVIQGVNFDMQQSMGDILLEINPMISLKSIKAAYIVICNCNEELLTALKSKATYNLFALRNLVAHRNGIVDAKFLSETGFTVARGEKITINPSLFEDLYMAARTIGLRLFECAQQGGSRGQSKVRKEC